MKVFFNFSTKRLEIVCMFHIYLFEFFSNSVTLILSWLLNLSKRMISSCIYVSLCPLHGKPVPNTVLNYDKHIEVKTKWPAFRNILQCIFLNENVKIWIEISLKFISRGQINNIPSFGQIMAWHQPGDNPLSKPMMAYKVTDRYMRHSTSKSYK